MATLEATVDLARERYTRAIRAIMDRAAADDGTTSGPAGPASVTPGLAGVGARDRHASGGGGSVAALSKLNDQLVKENATLIEENSKYAAKSFFLFSSVVWILTQLNLEACA